ncbi:MAG TPA: hypothetical protein H9898_10200 [Candidatus Anaerobiospirillum stercoravium]|nr:hypothetical protein [Candidatus Anaerobiospirillum stercoravium]
MEIVAIIAIFAVMILIAIAIAKQQLNAQKPPVIVAKTSDHWDEILNDGMLIINKYNMLCTTNYRLINEIFEYLDKLDGEYEQYSLKLQNTATTFMETCQRLGELDTSGLGLRKIIFNLIKTEKELKHDIPQKVYSILEDLELLHNTAITASQHSCMIDKLVRSQLKLNNKNATITNSTTIKEQDYQNSKQELNHAYNNLSSSYNSLDNNDDDKVRHITWEQCTNEYGAHIKEFENVSKQIIGLLRKIKIFFAQHKEDPLNELPKFDMKTLAFQAKASDEFSIIEQFYNQNQQLKHSINELIKNNQLKPQELSESQSMLKDLDGYEKYYQMIAHWMKVSTLMKKELASGSFDRENFSSRLNKF